MFSMFSYASCGLRFEYPIGPSSRFLREQILDHVYFDHNGRVCCKKTNQTPFGLILVELLAPEGILLYFIITFTKLGLCIVLFSFAGQKYPYYIAKIGRKSKYENRSTLCYKCGLHQSQMNCTHSRRDVLLLCHMTLHELNVCVSS